MRPEIVRTALVGCAFAAAAGLAPAAAPAQGNDRAAVIAVARKITAAFDSGDMAALKSVLQADISITDDMAPFHWSGPGATDAWLGAVDKDDKLNQDTDANVVLGPARYIRIEGDRAYAAFSETFSYKRAGRPITEHATFTMTLQKTGGAWLADAITYAAGPH